MQPTRPKDQDDRLSYWPYLFARLKPGVSAKQAAVPLNSLYAGILDFGDTAADEREFR